MLENKCPNCGRNLDSGYKCPVCSVYFPHRQDIKPTKEQIEHIGKNMPTWVCEFDVECVPAPEVIEKIVIEWEKIRGRTNADN